MEFPKIAPFWHTKLVKLAFGNLGSLGCRVVLWVASHTLSFGFDQ